MNQHQPPSRSVGLLARAFLMLTLVAGAGAQVTVCNTPNLPIPDDTCPVPGVQNIINIPAGGVINDLNVSVRINHTWVGDISVNLVHVPSGTDVRLIEDVGQALPPCDCCGCSADNIDCVLDDAGGTPVENACPPGGGTTYTPFSPLSAFNGLDINGDWRLDVMDDAGGDTGTLVEWCLIYDAGPPPPTCTINSPGAGATTVGPVTLDYDVDHPTPGTPVDVLWEWSDNGGATWNLCTGLGGVANPVTGIVTPAAALAFPWDCITDGLGLAAPQNAEVRGTVTDGQTQSTCLTGVFSVDNPPYCILSAPAPGNTYQAIVPVTLDAMHPIPPTPVDLLFEYTDDGGVTWNPCTGAGGALNPVTGVATPALGFSWDWDSRADNVHMAAPGDAEVRVAVDDGSRSSSCYSGVFTVDNTQLCGGTCGDCDMQGGPPNIVDALVAAQISAQLLPLPPITQAACCDVDSSGVINIIDGLLIAQVAAQLPVTLTCL